MFAFLGVVSLCYYRATNYPFLRFFSDDVTIFLSQSKYLAEQTVKSVDKCHRIPAQ